MEFAAAARRIATEYKTLYALGGFGAPLNAKNKKRYSTNRDYNRAPARAQKILAASEDTFAFDCVGLIKGLLWGWRGDKTMTYGGATYRADGVPDSGADAFFASCTEKSDDFSDLAVGEMLWMSGHCGIYLGDSVAAESTPIWADGVQLTAVANIGTRAGLPARRWTRHGRIPYLTYRAGGQAEKTPIRVGSRVRLREGAKVWGKTYGFSAWVYEVPLFVRSLNDRRAVVSTGETGAVTGAADVADLVPEE